MRWLLSHRALRSVVLLFGVLGGVSGLLLALLPQYALGRLDLGSGGYGLLMSVFGLGTICGGLVAAHVLRRVRAGALMLGCAAVTVLVFVGLALASSLPSAALCLLALGLAVAIWSVLTVSLRQQLVPNQMLGRVSSAFRVCGLAFTIIGAAMAGTLVGWLGISNTLLAAAVAIIAVTLLCSFAVVRVQLTMHQPRAGEPDAEPVQPS